MRNPGCRGTRPRGAGSGCRHHSSLAHGGEEADRHRAQRWASPHRQADVSALLPGRAATAGPAPAVPQRGSPRCAGPAAISPPPPSDRPRTLARPGAMPSSFVPPGSQLSHPLRGIRPSAPTPTPGCCPKDRPGPTPPLFLTVKMPPLDSATAALRPSLRRGYCSASSTRAHPPPARRTDEQTQRAELHSYFNRGRRRRARGDAGGPGPGRRGAS